MAAQQWEVVGGADKGGILVRKGQATNSEQLADRLATGAHVEEVALAGDRLHYKKLTGDGPETGWVSVSLKDKPLMRRLEAWVPASTGLQAVPGAEGVWEATAWSDDLAFGQGHQSTLEFMVNGFRQQELKDEALELDARYRKGEFPPCVYVERMMLAEVPSGGLLLYSVLPITPELKAEVDERGGCKVIVVPTSEHARHQGGWMQAFPEAQVLCPGGDEMVPIVEAMGGRACVLDARTPAEWPLWPAEAAKALDGFDYEVWDMKGFQEVVLCHQKSKSFFACDSIYLGSSDKADPSGWKRHPAPEWTRLYFKAFCEKASRHLPSYRMMMNKDQQKPVARTLKTILEWKPERILGARSGKTSEGGAEEAAKILQGHWGWCKP